MAEPNPSAAPGRPAGPAVEFAEWLPALGGSRLLRVHGEASAPEPPTLVLATRAGEQRIQARAQSRFTRPHEWRASYLIPAELVHAGWSETTLEWPDGIRLHLPAPPPRPRAEVIEPSVLASLRARRASSPPEPTARFATSAPPPAEPPAPNGTHDASQASPNGTASPFAEASPAPSNGAVAPPDPARAPAASPPSDLASSSPAAADSLPAASSSPPDVPSSSPPAARSAPAAASSPPDAGAWTDPPVAFSGSVFEAEAVWTAKRAELEREINRAAEAIAKAREGERAAREAVLAALAEVRADLRAARAAREADASVIATLSAELDAERVAHAVARRTAADLRAALARERRLAAPELSAALADERAARVKAEAQGSALMARIAELNRAAAQDPTALERHAREHAAPPVVPDQDTGELVANLEAAAAALRARRPTEGPEFPPPTGDPGNGTADAPPAGTPDAADDGAPEAGAEVAGVAPEAGAEVAAPAPEAGAEVAAPAPEAGAEVAAPAPDAAEVPDATPDVADGALEAGAEVAGGAPDVGASPAADSGGAVAGVVAEPAARPLRRVLVELALADPSVAGRILVGLLPAQGSLFDSPISYDVTVAGAGTYAVVVSDGRAEVRRVSKPRSRREARFELRADPLTLAELLAGEEVRIGRYRGRARVSRRRREAGRLRALADARMTFGETIAAGARLEPALIYRMLPLAIAPEWTVGHAFTVAQEITGPPSRTWYLVVRDGAGVEVTTDRRQADATVSMTRAAFDRLLRDEPSAPEQRPLVRGDRAAVALLKEWTDRARGAR